MCAQWWRSLVLAAAPSHTFCSIPIAQGHKVVVRLSGVTAVVGSLHEDAAFTDDKLREWSWRRKQLQLQQLMEQAELADEAADLIAQEQQESQNSAAVRHRKTSGICGRVPTLL